MALLSDSWINLGAEIKLKKLKYMINAFEAEYPYSVDQEIYCNELKKRMKKEIKVKTPKNFQ